MSSTKRPRELPTEVMSAAYWNQNKWKWSVEVGDPSGKGGRLIAQGTTAKQQFGIGARNGRVIHIGERLLNLFDLDHSNEVIEKVNAVIDAELANRETRGVQARPLSGVRALMRAQKSTSPAESVSDEDETLQRQYAALKRAYSKLQTAHWEKEQVIEQRNGEIVRLKAALDAAKGNAGAEPAIRKDRADAGSSSLLLVAKDTDANEAAALPRAPKKRKIPGRGVGRTRVPPENALRQAEKDRDAADEQEAAKFRNGFFEHFGVNSHRTLQNKLAEFLIARDPNVNTEKKRCSTIGQAKYKAGRFMELLWLDPPGTPKPYRPGNVDECFHFFIQKTDHEDMGRPESHTYANHAHRVAHWFWPLSMKDYDSFAHEDNQYMVRRARGHLTGMRAVHGLYEIWKGRAVWPDAERNPVGLVTPRSKAPLVRSPCAKRLAVPRKTAQPYDDDDDDEKKGNAREDAASVASCSDDSSEDAWSCADDSDDCSGGGTSRAQKVRKKVSPAERTLAQLFKSIEQHGV